MATYCTRASVQLSILDVAEKKEGMSRPIYPVQAILFVCTGNIFRSLAAEQALKLSLGDEASILVHSAGIEAKPQPVHEWVRTRLRLKGADVSNHIQRQLTRQLFQPATLVIAMGRDHQAFIREQFGKEAPLFNQVCFGRDEPIQDLHEVMPDWEKESEVARAYVWSVIDAIWDAMPSFLSQLSRLR